MYKVIDKTGFVRGAFADLASAMLAAKYIDEFVTIKGTDFELVGLFGADSIVDGKCPDGSDYTWMKRRTQ